VSDLVLVDSGTSAEGASTRAAALDPAVDVVDIYELPSARLDRYVGMILTAGADQVFLERNEPVVAGFLERGGVVAWSGQLYRPWLPGAGMFVPKDIRSFRDYQIHFVTPHPIFAGVDPADLTFRRGVAGFFARGHHPPPPGALVLAALPGGEPAVYMDTTSTPGTILVHAGGDLVGYATESTASRLAPQLFAWMRAEGRR